MSLNTCVLCNGHDCSITQQSPFHLTCECSGCGRFTLKGREVSSLIQNYGEEGLFKVGSVLTEIHNRSTTSDVPLKIIVDRGEKALAGAITFQELMDRFPRNATELYNRALLNISAKSAHPSEDIVLSEKQFVFLFSKNEHQYANTLNVLKDLNYIDAPKYNTIRIKPAGWKRIEELKTTSTHVSTQGFVAMWFDPSRNFIYDEGIHPAIKDSGFCPIIIREKETNEKIDDEIVAEIRRSRFVVADVTGHRGGVYFEAGLAMGLGIPVIWLVDKAYEKDMHFDTRQYSHIMYECTEDLKERLYQRIRATIF